MIYLHRLNFLRAPPGPGPRDNYPAYPPLSTVLSLMPDYDLIANFDLEPLFCGHREANLGSVYYPIDPKPRTFKQLQ